MTDDLTALLGFLNARVDEDAETARWARDLREAATRGAYALVMAADDVAHVARHNPARIIREVAAKRRMIQVMKAQMKATLSLDETQRKRAMASAMAVLRLLAVVYSDHPEYRKEWAP